MGEAELQRLRLRLELRPALAHQLQRAALFAQHCHAQRVLPGSLGERQLLHVLVGLTWSLLWEAVTAVFARFKQNSSY